MVENGNVTGPIYGRKRQRYALFVVCDPYLRNKHLPFLQPVLPRPFAWHNTASPRILGRIIVRVVTPSVISQALSIFALSGQLYLHRQLLSRLFSPPLTGLPHLPMTVLLVTPSALCPSRLSCFSMTDSHFLDTLLCLPPRFPLLPFSPFSVFHLFQSSHQPSSLFILSGIPSLSLHPLSPWSLCLFIHYLPLSPLFLCSSICCLPPPRPRSLLSSPPCPTLTPRLISIRWSLSIFWSTPYPWPLPFHRFHLLNPFHFFSLMSSPLSLPVRHSLLFHPLAFPTPMGIPTLIGVPASFRSFVSPSTPNLPLIARLSRAGPTSSRSSISFLSATFLRPSLFRAPFAIHA